MKVSIITPVYNGVDTIKETIESVLNQTYSDIEYIIIDGNSIDGTQELIERDYLSDIDLFLSERDSGIYEAVNKGIKYSTGDIVGIINSDDWLERDAIQNIVDEFVNYEVDIVYGRIDLVFEDRIEKHFESNLRNICFEMAIPHPATFIRREIYNKYRYEEKYKIAADYDLILRLYLDGMTFRRSDKLITHFRMKGISNTRNDLCVKETTSISQKYMRFDIWKHIIEQILDSDDTRIYIYGIGNRGKRFIDNILIYLGVTFGIVDADKLKQEGFYKGVKIECPCILKEQKVAVIITPQEGFQAIEQDLKQINTNICTIRLDNIYSQYAFALEKEITHANCVVGSRV